MINTMRNYFEIDILGKVNFKRRNCRYGVKMYFVKTPPLLLLNKVPSEITRKSKQVEQYKEYSVISREGRR